MSESDNEKAASLKNEKEAHYSHNDLDKTDTHDTSDNVHIHNELAFKGDDSDGQVEWTVRSMIAAISLGCLYTGRDSVQLQQRLEAKLTLAQARRSCCTSLAALWATFKPS